MELAGWVCTLRSQTGITSENIAVGGATAVRAAGPSQGSQRRQRSAEFRSSVCTFEGDKIARMQEYMDSAYANAKFGMG